MPVNRQPDQHDIDYACALERMRREDRRQTVRIAVIIVAAVVLGVALAFGFAS